jgi:hypothetical protein
MSKVVTIYSRRFLGTYYYAQSVERIPEQLLFVAGVILTVALPQIIFAAYGGIIPLIAFACCASIGSSLGWFMYRQMPFQVPSFFAERNAPPSEDTAKDKAA